VAGDPVFEATWMFAGIMAGIGIVVVVLTVWLGH
jgi:hypothetical protein